MASCNTTFTTKRPVTNEGRPSCQLQTDARPHSAADAIAVLTIGRVYVRTKVTGYVPA